MKQIETNYGEKVAVSSLKAGHIENIISKASMCKHIKAIILFGSSLESRCTEKSDIDFAVVSDKTVTALSKDKSFVNFMNALYDYDDSQEYDRLYFKSFNEIEGKVGEVTICHEIVTKGKTIYRRDSVG